MNEIWKDIEGYENKYQISNLGRVKSLSRKVKHGNGTVSIKEKILKQSTDKKGYKIIRLPNENKKKNFRINRLVAINFIENPLNKQQVNHIDGNKSNNKASNLEWNTQSENIIHAYKTGLNKWKLNLNENEIVKLYTKEKIGYVEISKKLKVSPTTIKRVLLRNKIQIRGNSESRIKFKLSKNELKELLKTKTQKEISEMLKLNERTICKHKKEFNL